MNYQNNFNPILRRIVDASTPFIHISGVRPQAWCRVIKDTKDKRVGPWRFIAAFSALDDQTCKRKGEVLYFVMSSSGQLKLVGQS